MKILLTGTHFTPAVAVAGELKKYRDIKDISVVYVGRANTQEGDPSPSVESQVLPRLGVKFIPIIAGRLQRKFTIYTVPSILRIPIGFIQAVLIIVKEKPDVILSFGGYVGLPLVVTGWLFSIPIMVHEQTLVSGLANRISSIFADKIALSFKDGGEVDNKKTFVSGNPIRDEVINSERYPLTSVYQKFFETAGKKKLPILLVMGGNQGSHIINITIEEILDELTKIACVIHVTGDNRFRDFERLETLQTDNYIVKKWLGEEYGAILQKMDLVISRAGANTLSELAYTGKIALVIPFEPLYQDEQNKNARYFEKLGLVKILPQKKLSGKSLLENIKFILSNQLRKKAFSAKKVIIPDASKRLALETLLLSYN